MRSGERDRELAFRARLRMTKGTLKQGEREVGQVTGQVVVPIRAVYRFVRAPGEYLFTPPERGHLVPFAAHGDESSGEVIIATMGYLDVPAFLEEVEVPPDWTTVPAELASGLVLDAEVEFEDVDADDEYKANEPADLDDARTRFDGRWRLVVDLPLGESFSRTEPRLSLDRWEFEVDARFARLEER